MQKYISLFFSVLLFATCKQEGPPPDTIEEKKMVRLLTDLHIADGELYTIAPVNDSLYKYGREKYVTLFKNYHVSEDQFKKSYRYYALQPEKIQAIYDGVSKALKAKLDSINKKPIQKNALPPQ